MGTIERSYLVSKVYEDVSTSFKILFLRLKWASGIAMNKYVYTMTHSILAHPRSINLSFSIENSSFRSVEQVASESITHHLMCFCSIIVEKVGVQTKLCLPNIYSQGHTS